MSSLCFAEAAAKRKENEITENEYLQAIINHCTGLRHGKNRACNNEAVIDDHINYAFGQNIKDDEFASEIAYWIICDSYARQIRDTTVLHRTLKAYRSNDVVNFKSALNELNKNLRPGLCVSLACLAILVPNPKILEAILEVHGKRRIRWNFHAAFDQLKHEGVNSHPDALETVRIIENSEFKSMVPEGKRFGDLHPLNYLA